MSALWAVSDLVKATGGVANGEWCAWRVEIDSRKVEAGDIYVALRGERFDGHDFVRDAFSRGAIAAIVERKLDMIGNQLVVDDCYKALDALAIYNRARSNAKIVGVTGSVGKTTTKEMLRLALAVHGKTYATSGNYNNHIGTPLNLANLPLDAEFAVFEMGMNHAGEIAHLTKMVRPHVALISCVEAVHLEHFSSVEEIAKAKAEIFEGLEGYTKPSPLAGEGGVGGNAPSHREYKPYIKEFARSLRKNSTDAEQKLWQILRKDNLGFKFRRQFTVDNKYIADFICLEKRLIIEIDGGQHSENLKDKERTLYLEEQNFRVIRFWNNEILENLEGCYEILVMELNKNTPHNNISTPHPNPPPQGGREKEGARKWGGYISEIPQGGRESFKGDGIAIINADQNYFRDIKFPKITFGANDKADCKLLDYKPTIDGALVSAEISGEKIDYKIAAMGRHVAVISLSVLAVCRALGLDIQKSANALAQFSEVEGRGRVEKINFAGVDILLINDSYNASPASMRAAFVKANEVWQAHGGKGRKVAMLGDMLELGESAVALHSGLAENLIQQEFDKVYTAGSLMKNLHDALPEKMRGGHAGSVADLPGIIKLHVGDVVLIKGSHGSRMYEVAGKLRD